MTPDVRISNPDVIDRGNTRVEVLVGTDDQGEKQWHDISRYVKAVGISLEAGALNEASVDLIKFSVPKVLALFDEETLQAFAGVLERRGWTVTPPVPQAEVVEPHKAAHPFVGRLDRYCEICGRPDRDPIHKT